MIGVHWVKLWTDLLDDSKMACLSDRLWRRTIELLLVAGEAGKAGKLPSVAELAWRLRLGEDLLESELVEIGKTGIVQQIEGGWFLPQFAARQAPMSPAERMRRHRKRKCDIPVTPPLRGGDGAVTITVLEERRREEKRKGRATPPSVQIYREVMHRFPNKALFEEIHKAVGEDPEQLSRWRDHLLQWVKRGYNPANLQGILDAFQGVPRGGTVDIDGSKAFKRQLEQMVRDADNA